MKEDTILVEITKMRKETGLSQSRFAAYFGIPTRTYQKWEQKENTPAPYIPEMMSYILHLEKRVKEWKRDFLSMKNRGRMLQRSNRIEKFMDDVKSITRLDDFGKYLTFLLELNIYTLNVNRNFFDISLIRKEDGCYLYCPIFNNETAYLSDTQNKYPLEKNINTLIAEVRNKIYSRICEIDEHQKIIHPEFCWDDVRTECF